MEKKDARLSAQDWPFHNWYRFVLSFPPELVRHYIDEFGLSEDQVVLDPFCGTGTTLVESKLLGLTSIGVEANPFAHFASSVKVDWDIDPDELAKKSAEIVCAAMDALRAQGIKEGQPLSEIHPADGLRALPADLKKLLLSDSISPLPLHKVLVLLECIRGQEHEPYYGHAILALAKALVFRISNLHFGPEVGVGKRKSDAPVVPSWRAEVAKIVRDLRTVSGKEFPKCEVIMGDSRNIGHILTPGSIDAVITSPPYPNEKDYTRTTRLESVLLGFVKSKAELQALKKTLLRSNTRGVYKSDDDDLWVMDHKEIQRIAQSIEKRRIELGKTSGFERLYGRVTQLYFGGMARHLSELRHVLKPGASLAYVVGDQASYLRVMIRTGQILADIAQSLGYEIRGIELFRTRFASATSEQLREEVVIMRWNGKGS